MKKNSLENLDQDALKKEILMLKKELFNLKLNSSTIHVKDYSQFKKLRKGIAQAQTFLSARKHSKTTKSEQGE